MLRTTLLATVFLAALIPREASAQSVRLNQYRMAETASDGFAVSRPNDHGHLSFGARLDLDYGLNPLVYQLRGSETSTETAPIVEHQLAATAGVSFSLWNRLVLYAGMPVNLVMDGTTVAGQPRADGTSLGDLYFGARGRLFGERDDAFALSLQLTGTAPTATAARFQSRFAGEGNWTIHPELLVEVRIADIVRIAGNAGALVRETQDLGSLRVGHELTWAGSVAVAVVPETLDLMLEAWGSTSFESFGTTQLSPIEGVLGARLYPVQGLALGLAGGTGLQRGYGAPDVRGIFTVAYATEGEVPAGDSDGDGLVDDVDECVNDPEDMDGFADEDGCPEPDNDEDGLLDGEDQCPNEAEDMDGLGDEDGCPEVDFDGDGAADENDRCPTEVGIALASRPECTGCPTCEAATRPPPPPPPEPVEATPVEFSSSVRFELNSHRVRRREHRVLNQALSFLQESPAATLQVEGHADARGSEQHNLTLSQNRAASVISWLVSRGVERGRLAGHGCGERYPLNPNGNADSAPSRRVELRTSGGPRPGCTGL